MATRAHVPSAAAFQTQACCCRRDACIPYAWHKEDAAGMLAGSPKSAGRGRSELASRVSSAGRAVYHPNAQGWMDIFAHAAGSYHCASRARLKLHGTVSFAAVKLAPIRSQGLRGGMRRMGATCTAAQTHMHSQRIVARKYDRNGAESGGAVALPSEWRPLLRSDRLLGLPAADRQSLGCSPAIKGLSVRNPPK